MSVLRKDLGMVTAYAYAVSKGYTGTEEEFAELMASYADVAEEAAESATAAAGSATAAAASASAAQGYKTDAQTAATSAGTSASTSTSKASEAAQSATAAAGSATSAAASATTATTKATQADTAAGNAATNAIAAAQSASLANTKATDAATSATAAANSATQAAASATAADTAVQGFDDHVQDMIDTIPEDYTELAGDVTELKADFTELDETAARIDGSYDTMTVGNAKQLTSNVGINDKAPYLFRTAGGANDIGDREEDTIVGGSVVWNQLISNGDFSDGATGWSGIGSNASEHHRLTVTDGVLTISAATSSNRSWGATIAASIIANHKYLITGKTRNDYAGTDVDSKTHKVYFSGNTGELVKTISVPTSGEWRAIDCIVSSAYDNTRFALQTGGSVTASANASILSIANIQVIDLTAMFGATIADYVYSLEQTTAGAGVAWLKKYLPLDSHIPYCARTLKSVSGLVSHKMTGFNAYDNITGKAKVVGGNVYQITGTYTDLSLDGEAIMPDSDGYFTPAISGELTVTGGNSTDTCVHLVWDGERDGEYEAYNVNSYPLDDSIVLRGFLKLDANNNLYYYGDTYNSDGTITRRFKEVDLGTYTYNKYNKTFYTNVSDMKYGESGVVYIIADDYVGVGGANGMGAATSWLNKTIRGNAGSNGALYIRDYDHDDTSTSDFKTAMSGKKAVYELATPVTEQADPYQTPQVVDDWGTEEYVCTPDSDGVAIPVGHNTFYSANLKAKLEMAPDSPCDGDGDYIVRQTDGLNEYAKLVIPAELPTSPSEDGAYTLKATVSDGTATLAWVADT